MKRFRSLEEIQSAALPPQQQELLTELFTSFIKELSEMGCEYDPDSDGEFVLLDSPGDCTRPLAEYGWETSFRDCLLEFVEYREKARCFTAVYIPTNSWGLTFVIPDDDCIDGECRNWLVEQLDNTKGERDESS